MRHENESGEEGVQPSHFRRDLLASLGVLAGIAVLTVVGLALEGNWWKLLRVLLAYLSYGAVLLVLLPGPGRMLGKAGQPPFWPFAAAAAVAELASGWLHPNASLRGVLVTAPAAALLIGGVHWLALRSWRPLRELLRFPAPPLR